MYFKKRLVRNGLIYSVLLEEVSYTKSSETQVRRLLCLSSTSYLQTSNLYTYFFVGQKLTLIMGQIVPDPGNSWSFPSRYLDWITKFLVGDDKGGMSLVNRKTENDCP